MNYLIEEKLTFARPRFTVRDGNDVDVYVVEGKALRIREQLWIRDLQGHEVAAIRQEGMIKPKYEITRGGVPVATLVPRRKLFRVDFVLVDASGAEIPVRGNLSGYEYDFLRQETSIASVRRTRRWKDRYELSVAEGEDDLVYIAAVLSIDAYVAELERRRNDS